MILKACQTFWFCVRPFSIYAKLAREQKSHSDGGLIYNQYGQSFNLEIRGVEFDEVSLPFFEDYLTVSPISPHKTPTVCRQ